MKDYDLMITNELLAELTAEEAAALAPMLEVANHPMGHVFAEEGQPGHDAFLILDGEVAVTQRHGDRVDRLGTLGPGHIFGIVALVDGGRRSASCTAMTAVRAATLRRTSFEVLRSSGVPAARKFQLLVARQLAKDVRRLEGVLLGLSLDAKRDDVAAALRD